MNVCITECDNVKRLTYLIDKRFGDELETFSVHVTMTIVSEDGGQTIQHWRQQVSMNIDINVVVLITYDKTRLKVYNPGKKINSLIGRTPYNFWSFSRN